MQGTLEWARDFVRKRVDQFFDLSRGLNEIGGWLRQGAKEFMSLFYGQSPHGREPDATHWSNKLPMEIYQDRNGAPARGNEKLNEPSMDVERRLSELEKQFEAAYADREPPTKDDREPEPQKE